MSEPVIARLSPYFVTLRAGGTYHWCSCGRSKTQPFCDGSHLGTGFTPRRYECAIEGEEVLFCGCKHTSTPPFCDGAHNNLPGGSPLDDPHSLENQCIQSVEARNGLASLDGRCYVISPDKFEWRVQGALQYCRLISQEQGAHYHTLYLLRTEGDATPPIHVGASHAILFIHRGSGTATISGMSFRAEETDSIYVRPGEVFRLEPDSDKRLDVFLLACPLMEIEWANDMPSNFDATAPQRTVRVDTAQRTLMGPRYFQQLVDKRIGSTLLTQFIGHIPPSKAGPHRHLYEESLIVLRGEGCVWTANLKAPVRAGDVIFLPRKQVHSVQAISADGVDLVGAIYPGDNPTINYY
jgi:quercetin dioxygenase-like cupin family protein/CDGSH-type Zn-finger protein